MEDYIVLVDKNDLEIGFGEKLKVHKEGKLHRAFSVLLFNNKGEILLQQRAFSKYHSGGLWTNSCCSHPKPNESLIEAVKRRLKEELLLNNAESLDFIKIGSFIYKIQFENELIEHEYDHVFMANYNQTPNLNLEEANDYKWKTLSFIKEDVINNPTAYTFWFKEIIAQFCEEIENTINENL